MPYALDDMRATAHYCVGDLNLSCSLIEANFPPMGYRIWELCISVMRAAKQIHMWVAGPCFASCTCVSYPHKISTGYGLIGFVDSDGIVRGSSSEIVAPFRLRVIYVGARVNQKLATHNR